MKTYLILKTFTGNQTGNGETETFTAGSSANLSDSLAAIAVGEGWAEPVKEIPPRMLADAEVLAEGEPSAAQPVEARETKVVGPEETKPLKQKLLKKAK